MSFLFFFLIWGPFDRMSNCPKNRPAKKCVLSSRLFWELFEIRSGQLAAIHRRLLAIPLLTDRNSTAPLEIQVRSDGKIGSECGL